MKKLINNIYQLKSYEKTIILLGFMGLIPFIIGLLDLWFNQENLIFPINIPKNYGVIILTFLGSVYWGIILNQNKMNAFTNQFKIFMLIWSITPALLGIVTLLIDKRISLIILSLGYLICQLVDEFYNKILLFPNWYIFLRRSLSITVITILICSYFILKY
ncbi:MAG: DUF3429 domain-containing protein [Candidatus Puniceispirillales bacterium]|jgi:hypothetical protein|tara:strand:- start:2778 stop:3260 length:483 start_codon:yes stop_codon:yes gene_type:complete